MTKINDGMDGELYRKIIMGELMDTLTWYGLEKGDVIFQQDNHPKHTARKTKELIDGIGLTILDYLPNRLISIP